MGRVQIVYYPDPVLTRRADAVDPAQADLGELVTGMLAAMAEANGVGLAAPQVGVGLRLFIAAGDGEDALVCLNPAIQPFGPVVESEEGCLSVPGVKALITRPEGVRLTWQDLSGDEHTHEFHELLARIIQHEFDHVEGVLFLERMTPADHLRVRPDLKALEEQFRPR